MLHTRPSLLERLRQLKDRKSWEEFVNLYTPLLVHWARRAGVDDAEDLVQDVFAVLVEELPGFHYDARRNFRAWLKTILMNILRKKFRRAAAGSLVEDVAAADPVNDLENSEYRQRLLARAMELMQTDFAPQTWKSFWECEVNGRAAAEVAQELGLKVGAVWVNKSRVLARLRAELAGLLD
ncbi:MAG: sigma-70 family RNA polymerase sigma factor [Gemmataceae bacterium]|nr:sigma-70 family RNA polymerase sigma factor [Gemmataceae bacterium]